MGATELDELLADAEACFAAREADAAMDILLEGLDAFGPRSAAADRILPLLGGLCCSYWAAGEFAQGKAVTARAVDEVLKRTGQDADPGFKDIYATACAESGSSPFPLQRLFRHQNLVRLFRGVSTRVTGDVAECGCARGLSSLELCLAARLVDPGWTGESFHVFDSFEGLSEPSDKDRAAVVADEDAARALDNMTAGRYAFALDLVTRNLHRRFPRVRLNAGWIPACFSGQPERSYRFVHIDVDLYQPTLDSLAYFFPRLAPGGIAVTDDYNWPGAKAAFEEFCGEHGLEARTTDTSQAYIVKSAAG